jgi:serine/threonine-protein kinase ATR
MVGTGYADPVFYSDLLLGLARGVKAADPSMRVLPAVFANDDVPARVNETHLEYLDGFNVHAYSYMQTTRGRTGVHPEHNMSTLNEVDWMLRFRDANAPGLPVYLTEWGWDSDGGGEDCGPPPERAGDAPFPECVSERAQALYAVRGALVLARKGLSRLTWYFYGNFQVTATVWDKTKGLFARSGLVSSQAAGFQSKLALHALEVFVSTLGHTHFMGVVREDAEAFVYLLGDGNATVTHVVAWRPVDGEDGNITSVEFSLNATPVKAWQLGQGSYAEAALPLTAGAVWQAQVLSQS